FAFEDVPQAIKHEADLLDIPVLSVPYDVPFVAISREAFGRLANERLDQLTQALKVQDELTETALRGLGFDGVLWRLSAPLGCSLAVVDETGQVVAERHFGRRLPLDG